MHWNVGNGGIIGHRQGKWTVSYISCARVVYAYSAFRVIDSVTGCTAGGVTACIKPVYGSHIGDGILFFHFADMRGMLLVRPLWWEDALGTVRGATVQWGCISTSGI